jgi:hypothetical protein
MRRVVTSIDEVHLLNDERGPVIETLVARTLRQVRGRWVCVCVWGGGGGEGRVGGRGGGCCQIC